MANVRGNALLIISLSAGFLLIGVGVGVKYLDPLFQFRGFVIACGIAAVFAGIGSTASVQYQGWTATGAAGIAILLFRLMDTDPSLPVFFVKGQVSGTEKFSALQIRGSKTFLTGRNSKNEPFQFVAFPEDLDSERLVVLGEVQIKEEIRDIVIGCIPVAVVKNALSSTRRAELELVPSESRDEWRLQDKDGNPYGEFGKSTCRAAPGGRPQLQEKKAGHLDWLISPAYAQPDFSTRRASELIDALNSDSLSERNRAREELARIASGESLSAIAKAWNIETSSYRTDLGIVFSWVNAIRRDRAVAPRILMALSPAQVEYLVLLTGYPDKTVRLNAVEVLSWFLQSTGWPGSPPSQSRQDELFSAIKKVFAGGPFEGRFIAWNKFTHSGTERLNQYNLLYNVLYDLADASCSLKDTDLKNLQAIVAAYEKSNLSRGEAPQIAERAKIFLTNPKSECTPN